ncbi:FPL domain-containing protein [Cinnamomum micranthum f. kanehirae]|uniref:FPL domain-containing protein n=1 Tax=Cinnamomum micranthum f. kanehirae TaxID=337451 RepID=A0A443PL51_9MAGN|nr:FPL domain-containing protein [Cinnamomum micranthum f. kanehirae]
MEDDVSGLSAETLWVGGWVFRQLLPYSLEDSSRHHPELLKELHKNYINCLLGKVTEICCDVLIAAIIDAWKKCNRGCGGVTGSKSWIHACRNWIYGFSGVFYDCICCHEVHLQQKLYMVIGSRGKQSSENLALFGLNVTLAVLGLLQIEGPSYYMGMLG